MSRKSSISFSSGTLRAMRNRPSARLLQEFVGWNSDGDLAWMICDQIPQREHHAVADASDEADENQESEKARHRFGQLLVRGFCYRSGGRGCARPSVSACCLADRSVEPCPARSENSMIEGAVQKPAANADADVARSLGRRSVVLVGMMGAGKSSVGRRLAARLSIPFIDADAEIESAAGMTIAEIFAQHGESYFRAGEARVIARLLEQGPQVLATGGGAVMDANTRALIRDKGISVWLKADLEILLKRTKRRG